uniref:FAD_binding_2 domain-containing protein n=1 Tax=Heterorhabditis bacteriophora TaxID=37862 RepID=A0A1I7WV41_HETBA
MDKGALFDSFVAASTFRSIQHSFLQLCTSLDIDPADSSNVYKQLRMLTDWKAQKLWKLLDKRVDQTEYKKQKAADQLNTLVIGAGPCGLRAAIECALLGSRVVVVEQRDRFSRNNVLHLWEFVIHDLKALGAKIFYPKFCTGSIEHIRFPRDEMRGKLAIGITANFINNKTAAEERVPEISGVAYIFNQAFFKEMYDRTGVDLENIVYYKDETHYFVMCAKKQSLIEMGVIKKDFDDVDLLLSNDNVDRSALGRYAQSAADFATNGILNKILFFDYSKFTFIFNVQGKLPALNFATNHRGHEDIAMFDFTSLYSSRCSVRLVERLGKYLLMGIVGDSLHEPFWPTGSGCARGFLGVLDTAWLIRDYGMNQRGPLEIIAERESVYRLLTQVTKDNLHKSISKYTIDPRTRYVSLEISLQPEDVIQIVSTDNPRMGLLSYEFIFKYLFNSCNFGFL